MPSNADSRYTRVSTKKHAPNQTATEISRSRWVRWLVGFYTTLVLFSWIMVCLLNYRPGTIASYQSIQTTRHPSRTVQGGSAVSPYEPMTSAVCSSAVVIYLQCRTDKSDPKITLRQLMVLADKGWTDVSTYFQLSTEWTRYGTPFLAWALALHLVGAIISPIQRIFLSTELVKSPRNITVIGQLHDMPDKFIEDAYFPKLSIIPMTKKLLESTSAKMAHHSFGREE
ncbi:hypothetical protein N7471_010906 [Penicillium samsonianum]|uniref:uncharacterized protein n=1 Tax=Penicillium samsonianum TaxID=1882272 RepID=UPI0025497E39|nr:uncharacterized protein N7471_010906 [Penicillium samsonianum]KAJ6123589.1 hypothetical protein N7471_010906 [Penicillium samsonianum]